MPGLEPRTLESNVLVFGGAGSIGSELVRQLSVQHRVFVFDNNETGVFDICNELIDRWVHGRVGDIRDMDAVYDIYSDFKPDIVVHAAALKHVPLCETYPYEAIQTNVVGTHNVLQQAKNFKTKHFVFISTDKAVHAKSIMGQTKALGETMVRNAGYMAVRFGNVIGSRGSLLPIWEQQVKAQKPITVTDVRMMRYFMTIPDACTLVRKAIDLDIKGATVVLDMGELKNIKQLADDLYPGYPQEIIGIRPGEQLIEKLMSEEELQEAVKQGEFYVIR